MNKKLTLVTVFTLSQFYLQEKIDVAHFPQRIMEVKCCKLF